jgi:transcriptional regulator with XRE-family HTH domain
MFPPNDHIFKSRQERELLGQKLAYARLKSGLTQMEAMRQSGLLTEHGGVSKGFLAYAEGGTRGVTRDQVKALAKLYGVAIKTLLDPEPLGSNDRRVLNQWLAATRKAPRTPKMKRETMSVETPKRKIVALVRGSKTTKPVKAQPQKAKVAPAKPAKQVRSVKPTATKAPIAHQSAMPTLKPTPGDQKMIALMDGLTESQKLWCVSLVERGLEQVRPKRLTAVH